jgi:hypothetical protein
MELVEAMADEPAFQGFMEDRKAEGAEAWRLICRYAPKILRNGRYRERVISILAAIADVDQEEYAKTGNVIGDIKSLLTSDEEMLDFLSGSPGTATEDGGQ